MLEQRIAPILAGILLLIIALTCPSCSDGQDAEQRAAPDVAAKEPESGPVRLDSYTVRGIPFTYYLVPSGLTREELVPVAQALHDREPKAHLVLVDDQTELASYIHYAKEFSRGNTEAPFPQEWADRHVVANVQKYISGKWMLCESYGYVELAELK